MNTETIEPKSSVNEAKSKAGLAASGGSASAWRNQVVALEIKTDRLRESAYKAGCFQLAADLQNVQRALYKIRAQEIQTPNEKSLPIRAVRKG